MHRPFVVLTALQEEAAAILRVFGSRPVPKPPTSFAACHELYIGAGRPELTLDGAAGRGILAQLEGKGRLYAAVSTAYAISAWDPSFLLIVGTAGGFESNGVALGDVVVATEIFDYETQRLGEGPPSIRWAMYRPDARLLQMARQVILPSFLGDPSTRGIPPRIHFGPIFSGDKVVASDQAVRSFLKLRNDTLGVEMEGAGVGLAAGQAEKPFLMVRGVADYADDRKREDSLQWSARACEAVAWFILRFVELWAEQPTEAEK